MVEVQYIEESIKCTQLNILFDHRTQVFAANYHTALPFVFLYGLLAFELAEVWQVERFVSRICLGVCSTHPFESEERSPITA